MKVSPYLPIKLSMRNPQFYVLSSAASGAEQCGAYQKAAYLWAGAMALALKTENRIWSEHRQEFCLSAIRNGWSEIS